MKNNCTFILLLFSISTLHAQDPIPFWSGETDKNGYMDSRDRIIIQPIYDGNGDFSEGLAMVGLDGKFGYIDISGKEVIPLIYSNANNFLNGEARVSTDRDFYINKTGKEIK